MFITILILFLTAISVGSWIYACYLRKENRKVIEINRERQLENLALEQDIAVKKTELKNILITIDGQNNILKSLSTTAEEMRKSASERADEAFEARKVELQKAYAAEELRLSNELQEHLIVLRDEISGKRFELDELEAKQLAYIQARQRQEEINARQDYYRLVLDDIDIQDIAMLRELQARFTKKESIDKLIWEVYYKPAYDILMSHLFTGAGKVCGIYQITDLTTGQAYIGQSVDIKERFRQHVKAALTYGKTTNKLYQMMQKSGVHNFTFEILEEVARTQLNEREAYWINFYKTKEFGLNSTKGNS